MNPLKYSTFTLPCSITLLAAMLSPSSQAAAQVVGGEFQTHFRVDGVTDNEKMGHAVACAGDVNQDGYDDIIVGSFNASPGGSTYAGSVYVYSGFDQSLLYQLDGLNSHDRFGYDVDSAGDVDQDGYADLLIGSYTASPGGMTHAGAVYVYSGFDGSLLRLWNGWQAYDIRGQSVAGVDDVDGDGVGDILIGASGSTVSGMSLAGAATLYSGATGLAIHHWNGTAVDGRFGWDVGDAGDVDGDGVGDLVISELKNDTTAHDAGAVYVYSGADRSLIHTWYGTLDNDHFGYSATGAGDVNGDSYDDVVVGAWFGTNDDSGQIFVYSGLDGSLLYQWTGPHAGAHLGYSVSNAGDVNRDGYADVIGGAVNAMPNGLPNAGSAYLYSGADGSVMQQWNGQPMDRLGCAVNDAGDTNNDGFPDVIVGAYFADTLTMSDVGSAFVYGLNPYLSPSTFEVSAASGGTIDYQLAFPNAAAGHDYKILISGSGTGPTHHGVDIPLTQDPLVIDSYFGNYPVPLHNNLHGTLDGSAKASADLTVPGGLPSGIIGNVYHFAAIANPSGQLPEYSSVAVRLEIVP